MSKPTVTIKMTQLDSFESMLKILSDLVNDERIDETVRAEYGIRLQVLIDMSKDKSK
ncbi:hypothetical protein [Metaclostridioides mangenotii]|uniref:hypothetical protein n=1 Tax=Metaclostridioides mangenotii TaxID=1540 RepID=UPI0026F04F4A|nr:hypothetical protein [Clostridioides mangenotii]